MARRRPAPLPGPEVFEQRRRNRLGNAAPPGLKQESPLVAAKTYRVSGPRVVHGKKKGELVDLWDIPATRALVQAGHLVEVSEVEIEDLAGESADDNKEADNG